MNVMRGKWWIYPSCVLGVVAAAYGAGLPLHGGGFLRSFSADIGRAFSATFFKQETLVGQFDFKNNAQDAEGAPIIRECAFDTVSRPERAKVLINEIAWMGSKDDYKDEWMELKNISDSEVDVSFWKIIDRNDFFFSFLNGEKMLPGELILVRKKGAEDRAFRGSLKNTNEHVRLFDAECVLQDEAGGIEWEAGNNKTKQTMERDAKGLGWHTSKFAGGTPGMENSNPGISEGAVIKKKIENTKTQTNGTIQNFTSGKSTTTEIIIHKKSTPGISIVEVISGKEGNAAYEFIKLKNISDSMVDLTGWTVKKRNSAGKETTLVSKTRLQGKSVPASGYFLLASEGGYSGVPVPDVWWPKSYTLAQSNNAVILYDENGIMVSEFSW